jgi:hypothetical protein
MAVKIDLTDYYPVKVRDDVNWSRRGEYCVATYIGDWSGFFDDIPRDQRRLKWLEDKKNRVVYFNSVVAQYDFNLIFGINSVIVKSRLLKDRDDRLIKEWLINNFGCGSSLTYVASSIEVTPTLRWRYLRGYGEYNVDGYWLEYAFANKSDAIKFKLVWG